MPDEPVSRFYDSIRLRLHYLDWGNEGAPPLLLIHGGRDHAHNWDWVARALKDDFHIIAPDLRGHGDSEWSADASYSLTAHLYDIASLIEQLKLAPVSIISHSFGGAIAMRYASVFPNNVHKLIAVEGLGLPPEMMREIDGMAPDARIGKWIGDVRALAGRTPKRYPSLDAAIERMAGENKHLSAEQARHLTVHGARRNEDGTYSWKFDNYVRNVWPTELSKEQRDELAGRLKCPLLLIHGEESVFGNPEADGRTAPFTHATVSGYPGAGHWVHHDQLERFLQEARDFLAD